MRFWHIPLALIILAGCASAWGPSTNRYVCREAVKFVWGEDAVAKCLHTMDNASLDEFCDATYKVLGQEYEAKCRQAYSSGAQVDPATVSADVFKDDFNHFDYSRCPVSGNARPWICGDGSRPAYDVGLKWFREAESASSLCMRIYDFCAGATYYADTENSLHQVRYAGACTKDIEMSIDRSIEAGTLDWSASLLCNFNNQEKGLGNLNYRQRIGESSESLNKAIANITSRGLLMKELPYTPKKGVVVFSNSFDSVAASELMDYIQSSGVNVISATQADFDRLKYNARVVIVGGQNAPEGVGVAAGSILSKEEEEFLLADHSYNMFDKDGPWSSGQRVVVLAGNEVADTGRAVSENKEKVLEVVR